jgi:hypothetical protein
MAETNETDPKLIATDPPVHVDEPIPKVEPNEDLVNKLTSQMNPKMMKKLIKKAQKDPKTAELIRNLQKSMAYTTPSVGSSPSDRIKERLNQCRLQRGGRFRQQKISKKHVDPKVPSQDTVSNEEVRNNIIDDVKSQKKAKILKLRRLQKKYGIISLEQYTEALKHVSDASLTPDQIHHERNVIDLYLKQNSHLVEKMVEIETDDLDGDLEPLQS